ncbi:hypothetical protein A9R01_12040 ['Osedax' symbiont bacterium Rs2_46_30_T18]|nr:hypothetical protein A9R01_12040 ['Osedax' symbiont bacterium Rs2_46_30_T18]
MSQFGPISLIELVFDLFFDFRDHCESFLADTLGSNESSNSKVARVIFTNASSKPGRLICGGSLQPLTFLLYCRELDSISCMEAEGVIL